MCKTCILYCWCSNTQDKALNKIQVGKCRKCRKFSAKNVWFCVLNKYFTNSGKYYQVSYIFSKVEKWDETSMVHIHYQTERTDVKLSFIYNVAWQLQKWMRWCKKHGKRHYVRHQKTSFNGIELWGYKKTAKSFLLNVSKSFLTFALFWKCLAILLSVNHGWRLG